MTQESFKPKPKPSSPIARPKKQNPIDPESSCWERLAFFCNHFSQDFVPRSIGNRKIQEKKAHLHHHYLEYYLDNTQTTWERLINQFRDDEDDLARNFFFDLPYKSSLSPQEFIETAEGRIKKFIDYAPFALLDRDDRDLIKVGDCGDILDFFSKSSARTFFFIYYLLRLLDEKTATFLKDSFGYQELLQWGASRYIWRLCPRLQDHFGLTDTAQKDQAAQNLAQQLGETERNLKAQIQLLDNENQELKNEIESIKDEALQETISQLARSLQEQPQPVLDQIYNLLQRLTLYTENNEALSATETLTCFIVLDDVLNVLKSLGIEQYPQKLNCVFGISESDLGQYIYVDGSSFLNLQEIKTVKCIRQGWRANKAIITPAQVKEWRKENE